MLTFGSEAGLESVTFASKEDGTFEGFLPRHGPWHVSAASESLRLHRKVDVDVIHSDRGAQLDVEVRLIPTGLEGELVDVNGERIMKGSLNLHGPQGEHRDERVEDGTFRFEHLNAGVNHLYATSAYRDDDRKLHVFRSDLSDVTVEANTADPAWLRIVLLKDAGLRVRLVSPAGTGVAGADVYVVGGRAGASVPLSPTRSDVDGRVSPPVLEGTSEACIAVIPRQFGARLLRLQITADELEIPLSSGGGTLLVDSPFWKAKRIEGKTIVVLHSGCVVNPGVLQFFTRGSRADTGDRWKFTIPNVEPGPYSFCAVPYQDVTVLARAPTDPESCVQGVLVPGAVLELKLLP